MLRDTYMQVFEKWPRSESAEKLFVYQKALINADVCHHSKPSMVCRILKVILRGV